MEKQYKWKANNGFFNKADANLVGKEIEQLEEVTALSIVDKARNENTELHKLFEWDDTAAAEKYRQHQAGVMLSSLQVVVIEETEDTEEKTTRAFVTLKRETEYEPISAVVADPEKYDLLKERAIRQFKADRERYQEVYDLQELFDMIDEL